MSVPDQDQIEDVEDDLSLGIDENQDVEMYHSDAPLSVNTAAEVPDTDITETDDEYPDTVMKEEIEIEPEPEAHHAPYTQQEVLAYAEVLASMNQRVDFKVADDIEDDPNDIYKPEGLITLEIDSFTDFCRGNPENQQRLSKPVFVRGLPWKILAIPRFSDNQPRAIGRAHRALGFFLQCNGDSDGVAWNCVASATLKVKSQSEVVEDHSRRISHTFYPKENDWGYSQFLTCDHLANPENGFIKNDCVKLVVHVCADAPHGVSWDSKKHAGYIGLKNQGATCYMNSILQTLFFTNKLRKAVYEMPTTNDEADNNVALAMQRVFYDLQHSDRPVGTKKLTKSFGWDSLETFMQHDVQELCRVLLDNLENKMKETPIESTIPNLFKGKMKSYIKCLHVDYESGREEFFYDIQLNIKGKNDIIESFREYTQAERLEGDNKYDAGIHGLQTAEKGVKFLTFPPVLHLQLMRFQYDAHLDAMVKINDKFEFPDLLNLNEFTVEGEHNKQDHIYRLHAVLVHSGDFHGGHYVVFINTNLVSPDGRAKSRWCKFDDDVVSRSSARDAIVANFGGDDTDAPTRTYTNAYMLVYVKQSLITDVLAPITDEDIPKHLRIRFERERAEETRKKKEKMEAHLYTEIVFVTESAILRNHGFDLFDPRLIEEDFPRERVEKSLTINDLYDKAVALLSTNEELMNDVNGVNVNKIRLWRFTEDCYKDEHHPIGSITRIRPSSYIPFRDDIDKRTIEKHFDSDRTIIYIEGPNDYLPHYDTGHDMLMFLKYYNGKNTTLTNVGHIIISFKKSLAQYLSICRGKAGLPEGTTLRFYEEVAPDRIRALENYTTQLASEQVLMEVCNGGILIFESIEDTSHSNNAKAFLDRIYNSIDVEIIMNGDTFFTTKSAPEEPILGKICLDWTSRDLVEFIGQRIGFSPEHILLWRMQAYHDRPNSFLQPDAYAMQVKELLNLLGPNAHDPRRGKRYRVFYTKMPIKISEMDKRKQIKIQIMDDKMNTQEISIFPERNGSVVHILEEAKREFHFKEGGTGKLRLVYVGQHMHSNRVYQIFSENISVIEICQKVYTPAYMFRVEEIPEDQLQIHQGEYLLPVSHFDRDPGRMFGVPFLLKVRHDELFASVKERLRQRLDVPDKEFDKFKFALVASNRIVRYLDMDNPMLRVNLSELGHTHMTSEFDKMSLKEIAIPSATNTHPFLGIDHLNKSRGARTAHGSEKAIVIHN